MQQGKSSMAAPHSEGSVDCKQWFGTVFTNDKAGMAAVDREKVKKVVYEMSKVREQLARIIPMNMDEEIFSLICEDRTA